MGAVEFFIDERVVKANRGGIRGHASVKYPCWARPVNRAEAHRTWLARGVEIATRKLKIAQLVAGCADRHHLGVRGWIVRGGDAHYRLPHYFAGFSHKPGKGSPRGRAGGFQPQKERPAAELPYHPGFFPFHGGPT